MDSVTRVQIPNVAVGVLFRANAFEKGMNPFIPLSKGK